MSPTRPARPSVDEAARSPQRKLERAVVGVDGSDGAGAACAFALWLAGKAHIATTLVHVCPERSAAAHAGMSADAAALMAAADHRLGETNRWHGRLADLTSYAGPEASVERVVRRGHPAAVLIEEATARRADLILVGSTGLGVVRGALGSVSSRIVERAPCSVMTFREGHPASPAHVRSVVAGVDGSDSSLEAVAIAAQLARALEARLVLTMSWDAAVALAPATGEVRAELRRSATEIIATARHSIREGLEVVEELCESPRPGHLLLEASRRHAPAILVVGSRGRGALAATLLGGTSRWLVNHSACPVLIARAGRDEA